MPVRKVREVGDASHPSVGLTLPKTMLREDGILDERGELPDEKYAKIERTAEGEYRVRLVDV
jgi:hypothetical protein